ncbi:UNVERIFIED_CONTAM: hypothetical protein PYX00_011059 [Menopon gallinae]|uniref:Adenine phosphoribosyltransferase n=1 Tax=Menopon gallinae TaxID=328185 RepID=A0AAW2H6Z2_9NEOP
MERYDRYIHKVPHFPKEGILFYDITGLFLNAEAFEEAIGTMVEKLKGRNLQALAALESRGFLFAAPLACRLSLPLILVRKKGKLPRQTISRSLVLEYGSEMIEIHSEDVPVGQKIALVDDLLATGGTMLAAKELLEEVGAKVEDAIVMIDLPFLKGHERLEKKGVFVQTLLSYDSEEVKEALKDK